MRFLTPLVASLKRLTKDFANDRTDALSYVKGSATLFGGQGKVFREFMPALISNFPDAVKVATANSIIDEVGREMGGMEEEERAMCSDSVRTSQVIGEPRNCGGVTLKVMTHTCHSHTIHLASFV